MITRLTAHPDRHFADQQAFSAYFDKLGIAQFKVSPDPVEISTEGAIWGASSPMARWQKPLSSVMMRASLTVGEHGLCSG